MITKFPAPPVVHLRTQVFDSSGNWTVPTGVVEAWVTIFGSGGGGDSGSAGTSGSTQATGAGGGPGLSGQFIERQRVVVTPGAVIPITIGAGGLGGTPVHGEILAGGSQTSSGSHVAPTAGGSTSFGSTMTALGGPAASGTALGQPTLPLSHPGNAANTGVREGSVGTAGGFGAAASIGNGLWQSGGGGSSGGSGAVGNPGVQPGNNQAGAGGAAPPDGNAGGGPTSGNGLGGTVTGGNGGDAQNGTCAGGGGGGGAAASTTSATHVIPGNGGKGANGRVIVEWVA